MQSSATQPPKPADKPGGLWVPISVTPPGCAAIPGCTPSRPCIKICNPRKPVFEWTFVENGKSIHTGHGKLIF